MQSEGMTKNLAPQHRPSMIAEVQRLGGGLEDMPLQLYAQFMTLSHVEWTVIALFKARAQRGTSQRSSRQLFRLLFPFLLLKRFGRFAALHMAELFFAQFLLLGFFLTKVGFWSTGGSSLVALRCHGCLLTRSAPNGSDPLASRA